jgi:SAM-dependent methyltransferase
MSATSDMREWSRAVDAPSAWAQAYVFRRSREIAGKLAGQYKRPGERWVDIGCGTGRLAAQLTRDAGTVIAVDIDIEMLRFAGHTAPRQPYQLCCGRAEQLPFPDASLHGIIAVSLAGCMVDPARLLTEARRLLRPGGWAVLTFTNRESWLLRLNYRLPRRWVSVDPPRAYRMFAAREVTHDLERLGLVVRRLLFYNHVLHVGRWLIPPRRIAPVLDHIGRCPTSRWVGRNFIVVSQKTG